MVLITLIHFLATELRPLITTFIALYELVSSWMADVYEGQMEWWHPESYCPYVETKQNWADCFDQALWSLDFRYECNNRRCQRVVFDENYWTFAFYFFMLLDVVVICCSVTRLIQEAYRCGFETFGWNSGEYFVFTQTLEQETWFQSVVAVQVGVTFLALAFGIFQMFALKQLSALTGNLLPIILLVMESAKLMRVLGTRNSDVFKGWDAESFQGVRFARNMWLLFYSSNDHLFGDVVRVTNMAKRGDSSKVEKLCGEKAGSVTDSVFGMGREVLELAGAYV